MKTYLEADVPEELCQHLFTSFKRKICQASPETQRQTPGVSQLSTLGEPALPLPPSQAHQGTLGSLPHHPMGMRVTGWQPQWVASGPARSPALFYLMDGLPEMLCRGGEGWGGDPQGAIVMIPPFPRCAQSPSHSMLASPCRSRWPVPLSQVLVQVATERAAAPRAGDGCQAPSFCLPWPGEFVARGDIC